MYINIFLFLHYIVAPKNDQHLINYPLFFIIKRHFVIDKAYYVDLLE